MESIISRSSRVGVIILNWNGCQDTLECLESLYRNLWPGMTVYVGDNGSTDQSVPIIKSAYPQCHVIELGKNYGFAEGNNRVVEIALKEGMEYILLLNNDTTVASDLIEKFMHAYQKLDPRSALGAMIGYYDDPLYIWDFGAIWDEDAGRYRKVSQNHLISEVKAIAAVDHIIGCTMFIPAFLIKELGLFDKRLFLNFEETIWCVRAKAAGVKLYSIPDALVLHKISRSFVGSLHNLYFMHRNRGLWLQHFSYSKRLKWYWLRGRFKGTLLLAFKTLIRLIMLPAWMWVPSFRQRHLRKLLAVGIQLAGRYDYLRANYGDCPDWVRTLSRKFR